MKKSNPNNCFRKYKHNSTCKKNIFMLHYAKGENFDRNTEKNQIEFDADVFSGSFICTFFRTDRTHCSECLKPYPA